MSEVPAWDVNRGRFGAPDRQRHVTALKRRVEVKERVFAGRPGNLKPSIDGAVGARDGGGDRAVEHGESKRYLDRR